MSQPFVGQLLLVPYNFNPSGYLFCQGQILAISQYEALYNLIGITYGGNGQQTFQLPDMRGRTGIGMGIGSTGTSYVIGGIGGVEQVTLTTNQMPSHNHPFACSIATQGSAVPTNAVPAAGPNIYNGGTPSVNFAPGTITMTGGNQPHANLQPYLVLNWCIAWAGIYPVQG
jgi:microcystin-dependent protein